MGANKKDPIPEHFHSFEEAGAFWDNHSAADYWDEMEEVEMLFDLQGKLFMVPVTDQLYQRVKAKADTENRSLEEMVRLLLERELV